MDADDHRFDPSPLPLCRRTGHQQEMAQVQRLNSGLHLRAPKEGYKLLVVARPGVRFEPRK